MKKLTAIFLGLIMMFCFVGCKEKEGNNSSGYEIDINYYMGVGQISEAKYGLGFNPDDIEKEAEAQNGGHNHEGDGNEGVISYNNFSGNEAYILDGFYYCYKTGKESKGIACIISTDAVYGFTAGLTSKYEVNSVISPLNPESTVADKEEFFYLPFAMENIEKLTIKNKNNILSFYFENDILIAASLYNSENWEF